MEEYSLFDIEKDYYLGNYQSCINKANSVPVSKESIYYMCLSYYHLKKYDNLELELSKSGDQCIKLIGLLVDYTRKPDQRENVISKLDSLIENDKIDPKDELSRILISSIYSREKKFSQALRIIHDLDSLASQFAQINIYLSINRLDLAERQLKAMQKKDDYATITLLAVAQVKLHANCPAEAYDIAGELEDKYRATPLIMNIRTAAAILLDNLDLAKQHCESSLDLDNDNLEAMINMIFILTKLRTSNELKDRYLNRLKNLYPDHDYVQKLEQLRQLTQSKDGIKTPTKPSLVSVEKSKHQLECTPEFPELSSRIADQ